MAVSYSGGGVVLIVIIEISATAITGITSITSIIGIDSVNGGVSRVCYGSAARVVIGRGDPTFISISGRKLRSNMI